MDATSLPPTCGEVMDIPGIPSVGCVAVLQYEMGTAAGFSCCVVASREEVYILGPELLVRDGSLISVRIWRPHVEKKLTRVMSLVAFLLHPAADEVSNVFQKHKVEAEIDEVCAVVAWEDDDGQQQQHITTLFFSLLQALSTPQNVSVKSFETSFFYERNQQRVLRLFYSPSFSSEFRKGKHVVLCSGYDETVRKHACLTPSEERNRHILTPGDPRGVLSGIFSFVLCNSVVEDDACRWDVTWTTHAPAWVASWILQSPFDGVVCSLAVQKGEVSSVVAAIGKTNGQLILFHADGTHVSHRFGGPIADLAFVSTRCIRGDEKYRVCAVTELIDQQKENAFSSLNRMPELEVADDGRRSLVLLDSLGRVIVLRDVTEGMASAQIVSDIQQFITLAENRASHPSSGSVAGESAAGRPVTVSSKRFFDISSLRQFFYRGKTKRIQKDRQDDKVDSISVQESDAIRQPEQENGMFAGHILSRGLLSLASLPGPRGCTELVVSTMGQSIVSIPFDKNEGVFSIAGFIEASEAMFFIDFVDFFNTGVTELVMAGMHQVLVARRSRCQQKRRAALLLRLLARQKKEEATSGDALLGGKV
ncbi:hypothetical protein TcG_07528 [Trypanosoma cruzi]|nr:hypothetical protein TcG_07528 [Trypanosoma cruzi]